MVQTRRQSRRTHGPEAVEASTPQSSIPKATPMSKAKSIVGKFMPRKSTASTATIMSPQHAMEPDSSMLSPSVTQQTPRHKSPKPSSAVMHPEHHHKISTPYEEAPWLGFFKMQPKTEPSRPKDLGLPKFVPTSPSPKQLAPEADPDGGPNFSFTFSNSMQLSPETKKLMEETREEAARIRQSMIRQREEAESTGDRRIAVPKSKVGRYSDLHMAEFKKMDSIANHPSLWRGNITEPRPVAGSMLKRSPSKAELDKASPSTSLKRSPSKAELDKVNVTSSLKRSPSKMDLIHTTYTPGLRRAPSKGDLTKLRSPSKINLVAKSSVTSHPIPTESERSVKRAKVSDKDDVSSKTLVPVSPTKTFVRDSRSTIPTSIRSSLLTPTKASLTRTTSVKTAKTDSRIPGLVRSNSTNNLKPTTPPHVSLSPAIRSDAPSPSPTKFGMTSEAASPSPTKVNMFKPDPILFRPSGIPTPRKAIKSILRTPQRLYSNDPAKIAAGTHLATPPDMAINTSFIPATAPVMKRVNFSSSASEKAARDEAKAASVEPESLYPDLSAQANSTDTIRRMTFSALPRNAPNPGEFTFRSAQMNFPSTSPTIRPVRVSDAAALAPTPSGPAANSDVVLNSPTKRKAEQSFEPVIEEENKENFPTTEPQEEEGRPAKRARKANPEPPKKIVHKSAPVTQPRRNTARPPPKKKPTGPPRVADNKRRTTPGLSSERLAFLSMPKKRG